MFESFLTTVSGMADSLVSALPTSPFRPYLDMFSNLPYLGYLNWFFPVSTCVNIGKAWLGVIALFYVYSIVMRWVKMIGD